MYTKSYSNQWEQIKERFRLQFAERVDFHALLAPLLAYEVGGPADLLVFPQNESELLWISKMAKEHSIPITTIGTGTNLLVRDEGIAGITISLSKAFKQIEICKKQARRVSVKVGGGVEKPELLNWAIDKGLGGLEFSSGVPGTIGGGIFMNAGTKYGTYGNILRELCIFDFEEGPKTFKREEIHFGYRGQSLVNRRRLVQWALFDLYPEDSKKIKTEVDRIIAERAEKQPLDYPSCGSTFKNPEGYSAGRLIEKAGLKGLQVGGAQISTKHANFILNRGNAKAADILELIAIIKREVLKKFSVTLECEVIVLGGRNASREIPN